MTILKTICMDERTLENLERVQKELGMGASPAIQYLINRYVKQKDDREKRVNRRMRMEAEEFGDEM